MVLQKTEFKTFLQSLDLSPAVVSVFGDENAIALANRLLEASSKHQSLQQMMSYDTTFELGDFYMSILVMRNTELVGDPIFPVLFMLHSRKYQEVHDKFWRYYVTDLLKIREYGFNVPIVTDRELALKKAIINNTDDNLVVCHNHLTSDVKRWLSKHSGIRDDHVGCQEHIGRLLACETFDEFDILYRDFSESWSQEFVKYVTDHLYDDLRNHAIKAVTRRFAAFNDKSVANNIS